MESDLLLLTGLEADELLMLLECKRNDYCNSEWRFNFDSLPHEYSTMFHSEKEDVKRLKDALHFPSEIIASKGTIATGLDAICILLFRLAYPNRLFDLIPILNHIYDNFGDLLQNLNHNMLSAANLQRYAESIYNNGALLEKCWGFIDGTARTIFSPSIYQRVVYSGHKRVYSLKFQSIQTPNGIIAHMYGPVGRRHDAATLSGILPDLEGILDENGEPFYLFGDSGYPLRSQLLTPFKGVHISPQEHEFNREMSKVRKCVEWGFGEIFSQFAFLDFKKNLKILLQPVAKYCLVGIILLNCRTCIYGNLTSQSFGIQLSSLESYLHNEPRDLLLEFQNNFIKPKCACLDYLVTKIPE